MSKKNEAEENDLVILLNTPSKCRDSTSTNNKPRPLPSTSFPIHYSPLILPYGAVFSI
jgi:hypothetical protein